MRRVLLITHTGRQAAVDVARRLTKSMQDAGIEVVAPQGEQRELAQQFAADGNGQGPSELSPDQPSGAELVVVVGGDGTILRAAEYAYEGSIPMLGLNLGHVGFLAEVESTGVDSVLDAVINRKYRVEKRLVLHVRAWRENDLLWDNWALNEAAIVKKDAHGMIDILLEIDDRPLSRWGCDGVVIATPTGSTAYTWSVGGPVVWPEVRALLVAPISAHALFSRSLVVDPDGKVALEIGPDGPEANIFCDGQRSFSVRPGDRVEATESSRPLYFARLHEADFTDRIVAKFELPVDGWRGRIPDDH
jgi:NAD+ kinase